MLMSTLLDAKTICLNMVVKDEGEVIERCLNSVKDQIDYWVIVDNGSSDETKQIIKKCLKGKPGELIEKSMISQADAKNIAFEKSKKKADYALILEADQAIRYDDKFDKKGLSEPYYYAPTIEARGFINEQVLLVDLSKSWQWQGPVYESLSCNGIELDLKKLAPGVEVVAFQDSKKCKDPQRFVKEAQILEKELEKNPNDARTQFNAALCYLNGNEKVLALKNFEKVLKLDGSQSDKWFALYTIARLHDEMGYSSEVVTKEYCVAFQLRPSRAEPLGCLALHHLKQGNFALAYSVAYQAIQIQKPLDSYNVENWQYDFGMLCVFADSAKFLGLKDQASEIYKALLKNDRLPQNVKEQVEKALKDITA